MRRWALRPSQPRSRASSSPEDSHGMSKLVTVFVTGKDRLIAAALAAFCETLPNIRVLNWTEDESRFLDCLKQLRPSVVIVFGFNVDALAKVMQDRVVLSTQLIVMDDCVYTRRLPPLHAFIGGYLARSSSPVEVGLAIDAAANGDFYIAPSLTKRLTESPAQDEAADLTKRHREILRLITAGKSNKDIANTLRVSVKTVTNHRAELMKRLRVSNAAGLIEYVMRQQGIKLL
jgi:DNA-binding NarL/FixJ family response regulator